MAGKPTYQEIERSVKELDKRLKESEYKILWSIFSQSCIPTFILSKEGKIVNFNDATTKLLKYTHDELPDIDTWMRKIYPDKKYRKEVSDISRRSRQREIYVKRDVFLMTTKAGEKRCVQISAYDILHDEKPTGLQVIQLEDITERKNAEETIRNSEEKFRFLAEKMADIVWTIDRDFQTTYVSPSIENVLGFTPEERKQQSLEEMITPESLQKVQVRFIEELQKDEAGTVDPDRSVTIEVEYYRKDGSNVWMENIVKAIRDPGGEIIGIYGVSHDITERKCSEEELRDTLAKLNALIEASPIAISFLDANGNVTLWSPAAEQIFGWKENEVIGKRNPVVSNEKQPEFKENLRQVLAGKTIVDLEVRRNRKDGSALDISLSVVPLRNEAGRIIGAAAMLTDITDRKQVEKSINRKIMELNSFINNIPDMAWVNDIDSRFIAINRAFGKSVGMDPESLINQTYKVCFVKKYAKKFREDDLRVMEDGKQKIIEEKIIDSQKNEVWLETIKSPILDEFGKVIGTVGIARNISKHKQTEEALQKSENRFRSLVESSPVAMCIIQQNKIVYQNHSLTRLLGPVPKRYENHVLDYLHPDDVERCKKFYRQMTSGRNPTSEVDFRFYPPGKKDRKVSLSWVQCRASLVDYQGEDAILLNVTDITRVKEIEHLLAIQQKMSSLGHVAAGIAHEIRNPLTGINSYLYTLEDLCDSEIIEGDQIEMIKQIIRQFQLASDKIEAVIKRVLDFSRPNPPKMGLIDLNQCIEGTLNLSATMLRNNDIKLEKSLEPDLPKCFGDFHLIEQVVVNLINNASRAMRKKQNAKRIQIDSFRKKKSLYIQVSDSGPGIPEEFKDKIFNPFFTTSPDGTGIGLSIAQRIISDHHGTIEILENEYGGATFKVGLPIEKRTHSR